MNQMEILQLKQWNKMFHCLDSIQNEEGKRKEWTLRQIEKNHPFE